jgi:hypothetical protein
MYILQTLQQLPTNVFVCYTQRTAYSSGIYQYL